MWVSRDPFGSCRAQRPVGTAGPLPPHLVDVVELEVLEQEQQHGRDGLDNDLLVPIDIHTQLHALQHCGPEGQRGCISSNSSLSGWHKLSREAVAAQPLEVSKPNLL